MNVITYVELYLLTKQLLKVGLLTQFFMNTVQNSFIVKYKQ